MSTDGDDLPDGWTQTEDSDERAGQYNAQQPIRYERADGISLHLQPATNTTDTDQDVWNINVVRENDGRGAVESLRDEIAGRDSAIETARAFMETYNERCVEGNESIEDAIESFSS